MRESDNSNLQEIEVLEQRVNSLEQTMGDLLEFTSILMYNLKSNQSITDIKLVKDSEGKISDIVTKEKSMDLTDSLTAIEIMMVRKGTYQQIGKKPRIGRKDSRT